MSNTNPVPNTTRVDTPDGPLFVARAISDGSVYDADGNRVGWVGQCGGPKGGTVWDCEVGEQGWFVGDYQRTRKAAVAVLASMIKR